MRTIQIDEDIYRYLCSQTQELGEPASNILRRLLRVPNPGPPQEAPEKPPRHEDTPVDSGQDEDTIADEGEGTALRPGQDDLQQPSSPPSDLAQFLTMRDFTGHHHALGRFLAVLSWLYQRHEQEFEAVTRVHGRRRIYFGENPDDIARSGRSTMPQPIPGTPWYVTTNTSTRLKLVILTKILSHLGYCKLDISLLGSLLDPR